jgi:hypothetical protein
VPMPSGPMSEGENLLESNAVEEEEKAPGLIKFKDGDTRSPAIR